MEELLTVEDRFMIKSRGLVIGPDFSVPTDGWKSKVTEEIEVSSPEGIKKKAQATFYLTHYNIRDPKAPIDRRWRVTIMIKDLTDEEVPVGSRIHVSKELKEKLIETKTA